MGFKDLKTPFAPEDIEWRVQSSGKKNDGKVWAKVLAYVTNRAIMDRLDEVVGPEGWKNEFTPGPDGGIVCGISIKVGDEWVTKWDGATNTNTEAVKGGLSSAMKRAAVQWGIGRYLYHLEAGWADIVGRNQGMYSSKTKDNTWFDWNPPRLPAFALPDGYKQEEPQAAPRRGDAYNDATEQEEASDLDRWIANTRKLIGEETFKSILATEERSIEELEMMTDDDKKHIAKLMQDAYNDKESK